MSEKTNFIIYSKPLFRPPKCTAKQGPCTVTTKPCELRSQPKCELRAGDCVTTRPACYTRAGRCNVRKTKVPCPNTPAKPGCGLGECESYQPPCPTAQPCTLVSGPCPTNPNQVCQIPNCPPTTCPPPVTLCRKPLDCTPIVCQSPLIVCQEPVSCIGSF